MKSLGDFDGDECSQIRDLLASRGIPTRWATSLRVAREPLYVCIDEQYEDALAVLKNPDHVVANPVDVAEFYQATRSQGLNTIIAACGKIFAVVLVLLGVVAAAYYYFWQAV